MRNIRAILLIAGLFVYAMPVYAQDAAEPESADEVLAAQQMEEKAKEQEQEQAPVAEAATQAPKQDETTLERRVELAKKMHEFRSTREQVDAAVNRAAMSLPQRDRQGFITAMTSVLNYAAIERISVDAMAETYTVEELEVMVDFYSKPEARSIADKTRVWASRVQPEIARMIDKAMMRVRMGAPR